ncbi:MAG TPA: tRNA glutamyl-Q(34) synthetase GluQRS [Dongiaceae bacterium]
MQASSQIVTRFAPSPTGRLHLGHAFTALFAERLARAGDGRFLLRIEDIDPSRCRPEFETGILEDLAWLGLSWETPPRRQSEHLGEYRKALDTLAVRGLLYPCFCSRREIQAEIAAAAGAPQGPEGPLYPGTCRGLPDDTRARRIAADEPYALRLDSAKAGAVAGPLSWEDLDHGLFRVEPGLLGDVVLGRRDAPASYHLAVTLDDHLQGVSLVTRGEDLLPATHVHRLLQALLGLDVPRWRHHRLLLNEKGERLAKRDGAMTLAALRAAGCGAADVRAMAGFEDRSPVPGAKEV